MATDSLSRQLALPFANTPALTEESFFLSDCNREAHDWITRWPRWLSYGLILHGETGAGKTHLAAIWRARAQARTLTPAQLAEGMPEALIAEPQNILLENADAVASPQTLLHLLNWAREQERFLLLTSRLPVSAWPFALPDLRSRLAALPVATLRAPDDALMQALLTKLLSDRQLSAPAAVLDYLAAHMERTPERAQTLVEALDAAALAEGRALTLPLARRILSSFH